MFSGIGYGIILRYVNECVFTSDFYIGMITLASVQWWEVEMAWHIIIFLPGLHTEFLTRKSARETNPDIEMARAVAGMAGHVLLTILRKSTSKNTKNG